MECDVESLPLKDPIRQWHRLFGILLADYLSGTPFTVELEKDLSQKRQLLDVLVVRRESGEMTRPLPDGLTDLTDHNLITFKSFRETLNDWALKELTGHYVNYRKSLEVDDRLPNEDRFHLYAICARVPDKLFSHIPPRECSTGVYEIRRGTDVFRIIVMKELPDETQNTLLHLFSAVDGKVKYGCEHHELHTTGTATIIRKVFGSYRKEGLEMPYTYNDFISDVIAEEVREKTPEKVFAPFPLSQRVAGVPIDEIETFLNQEKKKRAAAKAKAKPKRSATTRKKK